MEVLKQFKLDAKDARLVNLEMASRIAILVC